VPAIVVAAWLSELQMGSSAASSSTMAPITFAAPALDIKLTGQNYREWAYSFKTLLRSAGASLASHITDSP
jgi:hypothetical protein